MTRRRGRGADLRHRAVTLSVGAISSLETDKAFFERLAWTREGDALSFLKGKDDRQYRERLYSVVGYSDVATASPKRITYDPAADKTFPANMSVSGNRTPQWTDARDAIIFGISPLTKTPPRTPGGRGAAAPAADDAPEGGRGNASRARGVCGRRFQRRGNARERHRTP